MIGTVLSVQPLATTMISVICYVVQVLVEHGIQQRADVVLFVVGCNADATAQGGTGLGQDYLCICWRTASTTSPGSAWRPVRFLE